MKSLSKNQLKALAAYRIQKRCDEEGLFVVEGVKMCGEALASDFTIRAVCATADYLASLPELGSEVYEVSPEQLERLSCMRTPNKVWMLVERKTESGKRKAESIPGEVGMNPQDLQDLASKASRKNPQDLQDFASKASRSTSGGQLTLALDGLQDPGNMGTIMRTADWYGIRHIVCSRDTVSCYNPKVVQSTMGAIFRTRVEYVDLAEWLEAAAARGTATYGALLDGEPYSKTTLQRPAVLVVGNEGKGISPRVAAAVQKRLTIPNIGGTCESLNAAVATAILCSEFYR